MFRKISSTVLKMGSIPKSCFSSYSNIKPEDGRKIFRSAQLASSYQYFEKLQKSSYPDLYSSFRNVKDAYNDCYTDHQYNKNLEKNEGRLQKQLSWFRNQMILDDLVKTTVSSDCPADKGVPKQSVDPRSATANFKNVMKFFPEYRFEHIYDGEFSEGGSSAEALNGLHQAVQDIPGARQWIVEDGYIYSAHPVMSAINAHPLVDSFGHTGGSMGWTMCVLKEAYATGWDKFIKRVLPLRGIGTNL